MQGFILRRIVQGVITLLVLSVVVFTVSRMTGDPVDLLVPLDAPTETRDAVRKDLGLDQPLPAQYLVFVSHAVRGDFGDSIRSKQPAMDLVLRRLPNSITLTLVAMTFAILLSLPLGVTSAVRRNTWADHGARILSVLGVTMPSFLVGMLLIFLLSVNLKLLPTAGMGGPLNYIMPGFTLGLFVLASLTRLLRSSMLEVMDNEYIKLLRVKGLSERLVIWRHALRNSLIPVVTVAGVYFAHVVTMAVVVETVFAWPGLGQLSYQAVIARDFPVIQAVVILAGILTLGVNLVVDVVYAYIDPRIRQR